MSKMGWLHYLVQEASRDNKNQKELEEFLAGSKFRNPKFAAKEFIKAYEDLEEKAAAVGIKEMRS